MSKKENKNVENSQNTWHQITSENTDRRSALKKITAGLVAGVGIASTSCSVFSEDHEKEASQMSWDEFFKKNYKIMSDEERVQTIQRLESLYEKKTGNTINISHQGPMEDVLYGYVFNISKCQGYMDCVNACIEENNQDRDSQMQYIRIHQIEKGHGFNFEKAEDNYYNEVPANNHFYIGTQCFHCENPPCVSVCPTEATWKEKDGIVVVDYDWCIGCRYCSASCPYDGRRFNWGQPHVPEEEVNKNQHYLGNRLRKKGVMEKCTFCIQRSRSGQNPACVDACPTGARKFGNLLDPKSEIRWILENKKVFRLKEDLGTEPKFWYYMD
ncbi:MAG: 4Fe-4S dicluster domain-containing protein [Flavobacteriaceae bacterium]|nr:4Fe-4S dicluster domain-containing protein [Flavobacteriaceae bacterium]